VAETNTATHTQQTVPLSPDNPDKISEYKSKIYQVRKTNKFMFKTENESRIVPNQKAFESCMINPTQFLKKNLYLGI